MRIYGYVEKGIGKIECQDRVLIGDTILAGGFLAYDSDELPNMLVAVADGVGGYPGGEKASLLAVDSIRVLNRRTNLIEDDIRSLLEYTNEQIKQSGVINPEYEKMATTLTAVVMNIITVSPEYNYMCTYKKYLQSVTKDQTVVAGMVSRGEITKEEAKASPLRNQIIACMGGGADSYFEPLVIETNEKLLKQESNLILTSDGIHDYLEEETLEDLLNSDCDIQVLCKKIAQSARENGSTDDISIIIVDRLGKYEKTADNAIEKTMEIELEEIADEEIEKNTENTVWS